MCLSGTSDRPLTITEGGTVDSPVIYSGGGTATVRGIRVEASNVIVQGFISRDAAAMGAKLVGDNIVFLDNLIVHPIYTGDDTDGIRFFGDHIKIVQNTIAEISEGSNCTNDGCGDGPHPDCLQTWYSDNYPTSSDLVIEGNRCEKAAAQCLMAEGPMLPDEGVSGRVKVQTGSYPSSRFPSRPANQSPSTSTSGRPRAAAPTRSTRAAGRAGVGPHADARVPPRKALRRLQARPSLEQGGALHEGQLVRRLGVLAVVLEGNDRLRPRVREGPGEAVPLLEGGLELGAVCAPTGRVAGLTRFDAASRRGLRQADRVRLDLPRRQGPPTYEIRVDTIGGDNTRLDQTTGLEAGKILLGWPSFDGDRVYWVRTCLGDPGACGSSRRFQNAAYSGPPTPFAAPRAHMCSRWSVTRGSRWTETDANAIYGCRTDPVSTPQCQIEPLRPEYSQYHDDPRSRLGRESGRGASTLRKPFRPSKLEGSRTMSKRRNTRPPNARWRTASPACGGCGCCSASAGSLRRS